MLPFALGAPLTASNSFRFSRRFGRVATQNFVLADVPRTQAGTAGGAGGPASPEGRAHSSPRHTGGPPWPG